MGLKVHEQEGIVVVRFTDRDLIGDDQIRRIAKELTDVLTSASSGTRVLLDFQGVESVASMMLNDLVTLNKMALRTGVVLQFCRLSLHVEQVITTCNLHRLFDILDESPFSDEPPA